MSDDSSIEPGTTWRDRAGRIVLDPEPRKLLVCGPHGDEEVGVEPSPAGHRSDVAGVMLRVGAGRDFRSVRLIGDEPLRVALALVDAMSDAMSDAETEPDPAVVEELAAAIRTGIHPAAESTRAYLGTEARDA